MNQFNFWDLWDFSEVEIKKTDGKTYRGRLICVDEGNEDFGEDGITVTIENANGIYGYMAKNIEYIVIIEDGNPVYKIIKDGDRWQKLKAGNVIDD